MSVANIRLLSHRFACCAVLALRLVWPPVAFAQTAAPGTTEPSATLPDTAFPGSQREQVMQLLDRLSAASRSDRVAAERALLKLGPQILPWLPDAADIDDPQVRESIRQLRLRLEAQQARENLQPRTVTLQGRFPLAEVLRMISEQTSNPIETDNLPRARRDREVAVAFKQTPFWQALLTLTDAHALRPGLSDDGHAIRLTDAEEEETGGPLVMSVGASLLQVWPVTLRPYPGAPGQQLLGVRIDLLLEPRLHAVFLRYRLDDFELQEPDGERLAAFTPGASYERPLIGGVATTLRERFVATTPVTSQHLRLSGKLNLRVAAIQEQFLFPIGNVSRRIRKDRGGVTAQLLSARWSDPLADAAALTARLSIVYDQPGPEFESHRAGELYRKAWLESGPDKRREPALVTVLRQSDRGAELELRFENVIRGDTPVMVVYEAPRQFLDLPVAFDITDVPVAVPQ